MSFNEYKSCCILSGNGKAIIVAMPKWKIAAMNVTLWEPFQGHSGDRGYYTHFSDLDNVRAYFIIQRITHGWRLRVLQPFLISAMCHSSCGWHGIIHGTRVSIWCSWSTFRVTFKKTSLRCDNVGIWQLTPGICGSIEIEGGCRWVALNHGKLQTRKTSSTSRHCKKLWWRKLKYYYWWFQTLSSVRLTSATTTNCYQQPCPLTINMCYCCSPYTHSLPLSPAASIKIERVCNLRPLPPPLRWPISAGKYFRRP